ncbi:MAG: oligosaccharide flippase family protein [Acidobacteria bacterium]|nr:oligosaccharide flippase family protein [Acidobacteriota bacterium]
MNVESTDRLHAEDLPGVAKGAAFTLVCQFLDKALGFVFAILASHLIGLENFGIYNICVSVTYLAATVAMAGLSEGLVREGSVLYDRGEWGRFAGLRRFVIAFPLAFSLGLGLLVCLMAPLIARQLLHDPDLAWAVRVTAAAIPFFALTIILVQLAAALRVVRYFALIKLFSEPFLKVVFFLALFWAGWRLGAITGGFLATMAACFLLALLMVGRLLRKLPKATPEPVEHRRLLAFSIPLLGPMLLSNVLVWTDILLLGKFVEDKAAVGLLSIALKIMLIPEVIPKAFIIPATPRLASMLGSGRWDDLVAFYRAVGRWVFSLAFPFYLFLMVRADLSLRILSPEFERGAHFLAVLCAGPLVVSILGPSDAFLSMAGRSRLQLFNALFAFVLNVIANLWLLPHHGVNAVAWVLSGTLVVYGSLTAVEIVVLYRFFPVTPRVLTTLPALVPAVAGLLWLKAHPLTAQPHLEFGLEATLLFSFYALLLFLLGMDRADRKVLFDMFGRIREHAREMRRPPEKRSFL